MTPAARPDNLPRLVNMPDEPPLDTAPKDNADESTLAWCEAIRNHYEGLGQSVSVLQLIRFADRSGLDPDEIRKLRESIKRVYHIELGEAPPAPSEPKPKEETTPPAREKPAAPKKDKPKKVAPKPKPVSKPVQKPKQKEPAKVVKTKVKKTAKVAAAAKPSKNGVAKPSKNGAVKKKARGNPSKSAETEQIYGMKIKGVPVRVSKTETGLFVVKIGDQPIRKILQWMGASGWETSQAKAVCNRLLKKVRHGIGGTVRGERVKGPEAYVAMIVAGGHVGSGAKSQFKKKGCFGKAPQIDKSLAAALNKLRKSSPASDE